MQIFEGPRPPANGNGRFFVDRGNWTQLDPVLSGRNKNYPFAERDRELPYRRFRMVGLYFGASSLEVTFDLDLVHLSSLDSVQEFLCSGECERPVELQFFKDGWVEESYEAPAPALARIEQIRRYRGLDMLHKTIVRDRPIGKLDGELKRALEAWSADPSRSAFARSAFFEKSVVLEQDPLGIRFASVGPDSTARRYFGEDWSHRTIGRLLTKAPHNPEYERTVACAIRSTNCSGQPHYDQVVASMVQDGTRQWTAYDRLILPFEGSLATMARMRPPSQTAFGFLAN